jgi:hypothetical protein
MIPIGSKVNFNGISHVTTKDIREGDVPNETDFDPIIPVGTKIDNFNAYNEKGQLIYSHPHFIKPS